MELIPIIKASLGIFTLLTSITFIVSFVVYKIKNRNCTKPYERKPVIFDSSLILEVHDSPEESVEKKPIGNKFEVLNENVVSNPANRIFKKEPVSDSYKVMKPSISESISHSSISKTSKRSPNEVFNIYSFYSNNDSRPMYKLKVKALTAE